MSVHAPLSCGLPACVCSLPQGCPKTVVAAPVDPARFAGNLSTGSGSRVGWAVPTKILRTTPAVGIAHPTTTTTTQRRRAFTLVEVLVVFDRLADWIGQPFALRVAITFLLVTPIGLLLGTFLPAGLEQLKRVAPSFTPWAWGVNGAFSVLAPVLAVAFSMSWGTSALLLAALPVYLFTAAVLPPSAAADAT